MINLKNELGLYFENTTDLLCYFQKHYKKFSKKDLMIVINAIIDNDNYVPF